MPLFPLVFFLWSNTFVLQLIKCSRDLFKWIMAKVSFNKSIQPVVCILLGIDFILRELKSSISLQASIHPYFAKIVLWKRFLFSSFWVVNVSLDVKCKSNSLLNWIEILPKFSELYLYLKEVDNEFFPFKVDYRSFC